MAPPVICLANQAGVFFGGEAISSLTGKVDFWEIASSGKAAKRPRNDTVNFRRDSYFFCAHAQLYLHLPSSEGNISTLG